ncbi:hypothetical protein ACF0H5_005640 [Mactra antiquata]
METTGNSHRNFIKTSLSVTIITLCIFPVVKGFIEVGNDYLIDSVGQEWLNSLFYIPTEPRVRREYRMISDEERFQLHDALVKMKNDTSVKPNKYDLFASIHARRSTRNSAHRGTGFLGWHRVYTLLMENAIREWYPDLTLAYWDTTLDAVLELPRESSLWSEDFMGNGDGFVTTGVFKDWGTQRGRLYRTVGALYAPLADKNISYLFQYHRIGNISYPLSGKNVENIFEETHNRVHHFVGGEMRAIETAADDPVFFPYHSFISFVWQEFRTLQRQHGIDPETDWDDHYGLSRHHKYSPMGLGNLMAIDGSSEIFAENIVFAPRPSCSRQDPDCGSPHLYCNMTVEKCCPWTVREYNIIKTEASEQNISFAEAVLPFVLNNIQKSLSELDDLNVENISSEFSSSKYDPEKDLFKLHEASHMTVAPPVTITEKSFDRFVLNIFNNADGGSSSFDENSDEFDVGFNDDYDDDHSHDQDHYHHDDVHDHDHDHAHDHDYNHDHDHAHDHHHGDKNVVQHIHHDHVIYSYNDFWSNYLTVIILGTLMVVRIIFIIVCKCKHEVACCKRKQVYELNGIVNVNFNDEENKRNGIAKGRGSRSSNVYTIATTPKEESHLERNGNYVTFMQYQINMADTSGETTPSSQQLTTKTDNSGNYLDMTYSNVLCKDSDKETEVEPSDIFENESVDDNEDEAVDESYNSIENENFDYIRQAIREAEGGRSEDSFDVFDTYDNVEFKREADCSLGLAPDCDEDFYVNYFPGTYM